jgi:hypothetical protein
VRIVAIAFLVAVLRLAVGQVSTADPIQAGLVALRNTQAIGLKAGQPLVMLELAGTDSFGPKRTSLYSNAFFYWNPLSLKTTAKVEINDFVNAGHTRRMVADGTTLWSYSFTANTYTSFRYGVYSGPLPGGFRTSMFDELTTTTRGPSTFLARLLQETFSGDGGADYRIWLPGAAATLVSAHLSEWPFGHIRCVYLRDPAEAIRCLSPPLERHHAAMEPERDLLRRLAVHRPVDTAPSGLEDHCLHRHPARLHELSVRAAGNGTSDREH